MSSTPVQRLFELGDKIAGRYTLLRLIGTGVGSHVYRAADLLEGGRDVALKLVIGAESDVLDSFFERELASLTVLRHPNIIKLLNHGVTKEGRRWLALELAEGGSLADQKVRIRFKTEAGITRLLSKCSSALVEAHLSNVIHRDLKPANILFTAENKPKLADFNVSKIIGRPTSLKTTRHYFTDRYAAPEQKLGRSATERSDIYSLGVVAAELITDRTNASNEEMVSDLERGEIKGPLIHLIRNMLAENPADRPSSPQVLEELTQLGETHLKTGPVFLRVTDRLSAQVALIQGPSSDPKKLKQLLLEDLGPTLRLEPYRSELAADQPTIVVLGDRFRYFLQPEQSPAGYPGWLITGATFIKPESRAGEHKTGVTLPLTPVIEFRGTRFPANNCVVSLVNLAERAKAETTAELSAERARTELMNRWETYLAVAREQKLVREQIGQISDSHYDSVRGLYRFDLLPSTGQRRTLIGESVVYTPNTGPSIPIGHVVDETASTLLIRPDANLPEAVRFGAPGRLCLDLRRESTSIDRQERALRIVRHNGATREDLARLLTDPTLISPAERVPIDPIQQGLDSSNLHAIELALGSDSVFLVQGPPGTGKTTVIAELVAQIKKSRRYPPKILVASQSHVAVDNVLDRLARLLPDISAVRLGKDERIGAAGQPFQLHRQLEILSESLRARASEATVRLAQLKTVQVEEIEATLLLGRDAYNSARPDQIAETKAIASPYLGQVPDAANHFLEYLEGALLLSKLAAHSMSHLVQLQNAWIERTKAPESFEKQLLGRANVVAGTCLGFIANKTAAELTFDWVIVDEAARATAPELLVPLTRGRKLVLVGDHKQLPPILDDAVTKDVVERLGIDVKMLETSLFEDLFERAPEQSRVRLQRQYRMHPDIGRLISSTFYAGTLDNGLAAADRPYGVKYLGAALRWLDTSRMGDQVELKVGTSYSNRAEAGIVRDQVRLLDKKIPKDSAGISVGILSGYAPQVDLLQTMLDGAAKGGWKHLTVEVLTVDAAQGREFDFIFYSCVRSNAERNIGFLANDRRLNVALSRSKHCLTIVGDVQALINATSRSGWNPFIPVHQFFKASADACMILRVGRAPTA